MSMSNDIMSKLAFFAALVIVSKAQSPIAFDDICLRLQTVPDNLSCPRGDAVLQCYPRSELCSGTSVCADGSDEGTGVLALDCTGMFTGRVTPPIAAFVCAAGESIVIVELDQLCDGVAECPDGDDEKTLLCENKCLFPYYGSCPYTRECISADSDQTCGACLAGFAGDPSNSTGDCLIAEVSFSQTTYTISETVGSFIGDITLTTGGVLESEIVITVQTIDGTAVDGSDYTSTTSTLTFPVSSSGGTAVSFSIPIIDDAVAESAEMFLLSASIIGGNFSVVGEKSTVTIIDNDGPIATTPPPVALTCPDNLACPRDDNVTQCFAGSEICDLAAACSDGSDEGLGNLECKVHACRGTVLIFSCTPGPDRLFYASKLCDGVPDCLNGVDETDPICQDKCRLPYYGGCPSTRECISTPERVICGNCTGDLVSDPEDFFGECIPFAILFVASTPRIIGNRLEVEFITNLPLALAVCSLESEGAPRMEINCTSGTANFTDLLEVDCPYTLRVFAVSQPVMDDLTPSPLRCNTAGDPTAVCRPSQTGDRLLLPRFSHTRIKFPIFPFLCQMLEIDKKESFDANDPSTLAEFQLNPCVVFFKQSPEPVDPALACLNFSCVLSVSNGGDIEDASCSCPYIADATGFQNGLTYTVQINLNIIQCQESCLPFSHKFGTKQLGKFCFP